MGYTGRCPPSQNREGATMSSHDMKNPNGGVNMRHVTEPPDPNVGFVKRPVRLSASGGDPHAGCCGVWAEKPPAT